MRALHFITFLTLLGLLLAIGQYYILSRFSHYLSLSMLENRLLTAFGIVMFLLTMFGMPLIRSLPRPMSSPLAWVVFSWMGILLLTTVIMLITDVAYVGTNVAWNSSIELDPSRRVFFQKLFGISALAGTTLLSGFSFWNALRAVAVKPIEVTLKNLPRALDGIRIVQLTDLHLGPTIDGKWLRHVVETTNALHPDIIAITGDLVDGSVETLSQFAVELKNLKSQQGVYFVTGNHEYYSGVDDWLAFLPTLGIKVLRNECITLSLNGAHLNIAGIDDFSASQFPGHGPDLSKALHNRDQSIPLVLLAHQPKAVIEAAQLGVDLQLSGHTHGGQIWPWNFLVLLQQPYIKGLHTHAGSATQIYISDGTGYWGPPMRLGTKAEITEVTLRSSA